MKRRRVLGGVGGIAVTATAGCLDQFQGELRRPIPIQIRNEGERSYNVQLEAYERETDRQTYDESYTITANEQVKPPNIEGSEQRFRVIRFDGDGNQDFVETGAVTPETHLVRIEIFDDDLRLRITEDEDAELEDPGNETGGSENESAANGNGTRSRENATGSDGDDPDGGDPDESSPDGSDSDDDR